MGCIFCKNYKYALIGDFQKIYHLDFEKVFEEDKRRAVLLAGRLGKDSECYREKVGGPLPTTFIEKILIQMEYHLRILIWLQTKDGQNGNNLPEAYIPDYLREESDDISIDDLTPEEWVKYILDGRENRE